MKDVLFRNNIVVKSSPIHGYGVFAVQDILQGDLIEECHVIIIQESDEALERYLFSWETVDKMKGSAVVLGYGSIFNHSDQPNAGFKINLEEQLLIFSACKNIKKGEEIFVSYGGSWFADRNIHQKKPHAFWYWLKSPSALILWRFIMVLFFCLLIILSARYLKF